MNTKYPLSVADCTNGKYTIVTKQGNHFAATYDPDACRLIAAAPELLEALQELYATMPDCAEGSLVDKACQKARAALAKHGGAK